MESPGEETKGRSARKGRIISYAIILAGSFVIMLSPFVDRPLFFLFVYAGVFISAAGGLSMAFTFGGPKVRSQRRRLAIGSVLILGGFILGTILINLYVPQLPAEQSTFAFLFSFGLFLGLPIVGAVVMALAMRGAFVARLLPPPNILEAFKQIEPERIIEARKCTVVKKGDIYAVIPKSFNAVYFVRFMTPVKTPDTKMRLPMRLRWSNFRDEVDGFPIAELRGEFSIPVSVAKIGEKVTEEKCIRGKATLLVMARRGKVRFQLYYTSDTALMNDLSGKFSKDTALTIINKLSTMQRPKTPQ